MAHCFPLKCAIGSVRFSGMYITDDKYVLILMKFVLVGQEPNSVLLYFFHDQTPRSGFVHFHQNKIPGHFQDVSKFSRTCSFRKSVDLNEFLQDFSSSIIFTRLPWEICFTYLRELEFHLFEEVRILWPYFCINLISLPSKAITKIMCKCWPP